ncbi:salicylate synthase [Pseudonocardia sp. HH130630-07]|uniref:salicylate synthase n=1 Tax=Pseudonocardia sp. HH130630-07 TaxID=1690815 RepID=UPI0008152FEF|nr:salicylate synthase [Pseudonocardia sp. HH130630-07]ANY10558.1 hypothetical protein AFB00_29560 [Pseudonocardia sp. HH130630-07]
MSTATDSPHRDIPGTAPAVDPIAGGAALARLVDPAEPFVLYERDRVVGVALGAAAELVVTPTGLRVTDVHGRTRTEPIDGTALDRIAAAVGDFVPAGRRAYGWAAFELSYLIHGLPVPAGAGDLLRLVLPTTEVRVSTTGTDIVHTDDPERARDLRRAVSEATPGPERGTPIPVDEDDGADRYRRIVATAISEIHADRFRKVILSRAVPVAGDVDLVATYERGRRNNTPARSFLLRLGGLTAAGFSPETVVEVTDDGAFSTQPLAGTRARHGDDLVDGALRDELLQDPKEIYEHAVSVQTAQDEVADVAAPGSVHVDGFMHVVPRGSVQHLASRVRGRLRPGATAWDALARLFPAVTASGLPKTNACAAISRHEDGPRGLYSGAVLTIDGDGGLDAALALRTLYQQEGRTWLRAGAGIVGTSDPDRELEETREKLRSVSRFLIAREQVRR